MLAPNYYEIYADEAVSLYRELENDIISDIIRRIIKTGKITATAEYQLEILRNSGLLYDDILNEISKKGGLNEKKIREIFENSGRKTVESDNEVYRENGLKTVEISQSKAMKKVLDSRAKKTFGNVKNLTLTTADTSQTAYINACNSAYMQVVSGAFSYQEAIKNAVKKTAENGVTVRYPSGKTDRMDIAVRRAVLTGVGQTAREISLINAEEAGCDLMEISAHSGARPSHAKWQGKIVSLSGKKGYLSKRDIGYGSGDGFGGWNCRHDWYPFFEGRSKRNYTEKDLQKLDEKSFKYNGEEYSEYEISQIQRKMEREIRSAKREQLAFQTAFDECDDPETKKAMRDSLNDAKRKVAEKQAKMRDFVSQMGQDRDYFREQIYSDKPTKNNFGKDLTSVENSGKIIIASNAHPRNVELEDKIKRCINSELPIFADDLFNRVRKIKPPNNEYVVGLHGSDTNTWIFGTKIDAKILANILKSRKDYNRENIYLFSCNTGNTTRTENCFAQQLANILNVIVYAPTEYGVIFPNGRHYSGTIDFKPSGEIKPFKPRR